MCRRYDFDFAKSAEDVGMASGATIHTANGLWMKVKQRTDQASPPTRQPTELVKAQPVAR